MGAEDYGANGDYGGGEYNGGGFEQQNGDVQSNGFDNGAAFQQDHMVREKACMDAMDTRMYYYSSINRNGKVNYNIDIYFEISINWSGNYGRKDGILCALWCVSSGPCAVSCAFFFSFLHFFA